MRKRYFIIGVVLVFIASLFTLKFIQEKEARKDVSSLNVYKAMLRCRTLSAKAVNMRIGTTEYKIPLPKASAKVQDQIFITKTINMDEYFDEILPSSGWKRCDNFGDVHVIKNENGKDTFLFLAKPYSKSHMMINYKSL